MSAFPITTYPTGSVGEFAGVQQVVTLAQPVAATNWTYTLPSGYFYRPLGITWKFVADATVGNRFPGVRVTDGVNEVWRAGQQNAIVASETTFISAFTGAITAAVGGGAGFTTFSIPAAWLPQGYVFTSLSTFVGAADQLSLVVLWLECLDYGPLGQRQLTHRRTIEEVERMVEIAGSSASTADGFK